MQRLHRSSYASEVKVTNQVEVQKNQPNKATNQTNSPNHTNPKTTPTETATWYVAQAAVSAKEREGETGAMNSAPALSSS